MHLMINVHAAALKIILMTPHKVLLVGNIIVYGAQTAYIYTISERVFKFQCLPILTNRRYNPREVFYWLLNDSSIKRIKVWVGKLVMDSLAADAERRDQMHKGELRTTQPAHMCAGWCGYSAHMPWRKDFSKVLLSTLLLASACAHCDVSFLSFSCAWTRCLGILALDEKYMQDNAEKRECAIGDFFFQTTLSWCQWYWSIWCDFDICCR